MLEILPKNLILLAKICPAPLYVVGGAVRDHLAGHASAAHDWDICSPLPAELFAETARANGFSVKAVYKNTGTVKLSDGEHVDYEYSCFRSDKYVRGTHVPVEIYFTDDIRLDALRRDFTANAVYFDVAANKFVDPLGGIPAIHERRLTTVAPAEKVFGEDGLRLMRLARQAAQLGFAPDAECLEGARENAALILDISPERIFAELSAILAADGKYGAKDGHYRGLKILEETGVLAHILPELTLGKNMIQRADFHKYDVLEHSLRAVLYAPPSVRLAALLHDVGKPACTLRDGHSHEHPTQGETIARSVLSRLKAPKKLIEQTAQLVRLHMYDFDCKTSEKKIRRFLVAHQAILPELLALKQADFSACMDDPSPAPTCTRWKELLDRMHAEHVPFTLKELAIDGRALLDLGVQPPHVSTLLNGLLAHVAVCPKDNTQARLTALARGMEKSLLSAK